MEDWQRKFIWRNLNSLIKNTIINPQLISELTLFLSEDDDAVLEAKLRLEGKLAQAKLFYDIAIKRAGMYTPLALALFETKQTGAFSVLMRGFMEVSEDGAFLLSELGNALPSTLEYQSAEINTPTLFIKIDDNDVLNQAVHNCFKSKEIQISHSWWVKSKYSSEKIESFEFINKRLFSFLELLMSKHKTVLTNLLERKVTKEFISKWVHACVINNHFNLLNAAVERGESEKVFESKYLLFLAVTYSDAQINELIVRHYIQQSNIPFQNAWYKFRRDTNGNSIDYSIFDVAALRGSFPVMKILLKNTFNTSGMELVIHRCVVDTQFLPDDKVNERKRIIDLILQKHPTLIQSRSANGSTPLHYPKIHIDLIIYLINLGVDVHATDENSSNLLHLCPKYMTSEEYDKLIRHLDVRGESKLFLSTDQWKCTPLHRAMTYLEVLVSTLEIFAAAKADFNAVDEIGSTSLRTAVMDHRSERVLNSLIYAGADITIRGQYNRTVLHNAAGNDNLTALRLFISRGCDVNATDEDNFTPLHLALDLSKTKTHAIVEELVKNGANVNALTKFSRSPLYWALEKNKNGDVENRTIELLRKAGAK